MRDNKQKQNHYFTCWMGRKRGHIILSSYQNLLQNKLKSLILNFHLFEICSNCLWSESDTFDAGNVQYITLIPYDFTPK
jgi:hypothetical protein